jgi:hypothetical protein
MRARTLVIVASCLASCLATACGSSSLSSPVDGAAPADGAPSDLATPDSGVDAAADELRAGCPPALVTAAELASTPRADVNLELLAIDLDPGKVVAGEATYQRVVRDVGAIRAKEPAVAKIGYFPHHDGRTIGFVLPLETAAQIEAGTYHAWDCLNETYGAKLPPELIRIGNAAEVFAYLELKGNYSVERLAAEYARLPGITSTEGNGVGGDGPTICVTAGPSTWHYVFDAASGDCPAGCIDHTYRHFTTDPAGAVTALETWSTGGATPRPAWVTDLASPAACH